MRTGVAVLVGVAIAALFTQSPRAGGQQGAAGSSPGAVTSRPSSDATSGRISGRVLDAKSRQPLANAMIRVGNFVNSRVNPEDRGTTSKLDGAFELSRSRRTARRTLSCKVSSHAAFCG